jgi:hypothetical protein
MATPGHRPGGLTALAVLNFIFGGLGGLGLLLLFGLMSAADSATQGEITRNIPNKSLIYVALLLGAINVVLLITSGVGYLGQKRFLGKTLGTIYGLLALLGTGLDLALISKTFSIGTIIGLIYPVLTLALLNTTFADDFPNP